MHGGQFAVNYFAYVFVYSLRIKTACNRREGVNYI